MQKRLLFAVVFGVLVSASSAHAEAPRRAPVTVGEVSVSAAGALPDAAATLRRAVEAELGAIDWSHSKGKRRKLTLSAALVRLESVRADAKLSRTTCTVSATLRDEGGALYAIVEGRARAEDATALRAETEREALKVAVRGALVRVAEAVDRGP